VRVAVVGIGHELRGDDAAGVLIARSLQRRSQDQAGDRLLAIDGGMAPENVVGVLRRFGPDLVLLVDAAQMGDAPGTVVWLAWQDAEGIGASTHAFPVALLAGYLVGELGCTVALLGIQPADTSLDAPLSPGVRQAVDTVVRQLAAVFCWSAA
jgi:hydrogenase maturation protease HycI